MGSMRFTLGAIYEVLKHRKFAATVAYLPAAKRNKDSAKAVSTLICSFPNSCVMVAQVLTRPLYKLHYLCKSPASRPLQYPTGANGNSLAPFGTQPVSIGSRGLMVAVP